MKHGICLDFAVLIGATLLSLGCGSTDSKATGGEAGSSQAGSGNEEQQLARLPLALASSSGCFTDADCAEGRFCFQGQCSFECTKDDDCKGSETCSDRGRCLEPAPAAAEENEPAPEPKPAVDDYDPSVQVVKVPDTVYYVRAGQKEVTLKLELNRALPKAGLAYTIERSDEESPSRKVFRAVGDGKSVEIPISVGSLEGGVVNATVATGLGAYRIALVPTEPVAGLYAGQAQVSVFGQTGLPMALEVVTRPDNVPLDEAEQAWLLLPRASDSLFSPVEAFEGAPEFVVTPLEYDDFVKRWVATTEYEYRLGDSSVLTAESGQVLRSLRFEIEPLEGGVITGRFSDRWKGLYDARSAEGVLDFVDLVFEGELELQRVGDALASDKLPDPLEMDLPTPAPLPAPPVSLCTGESFFPADPVTIDEVEYGCGTITSRSSFKDATAADQAACALAAAYTAQQGNTTSRAIAAFLDEDVEDPGGQSFAEFMEACANGTDGTCVPTDEILCARQLLAHAFYNQEEDSPVTRQLIIAYQDATREAFLGRQLAAFKIDNDTRLKWLKTSDYPAIVTSAVEDLVSKLLDEWQKGVLDAHMSVLGGYFDPSGLAVMSRAATGTALDARRRLLANMVQGWRGSMDALVVATNRWHELYQDAGQRAEKAVFVRSRMLDLYLMAGILTNLSRDAGSGYQATAFGAGFSELVRSTNQLGLSFDDLVFARDAEVVVSTSLDPTSDNESILSELRANAESEITDAAEAVQTVLSQAEAEALAETQLENRMANEINDLRDDLVGLCGLPVGCTAKEFRSKPECAVQVAAGECGFLLERGSGDYLAFNAGQQSVSEAGRSLLSFADASQAVGIAAEEVRAHSSQLTLELATLESLAKNVADWNEERLDGVNELSELLEDQGAWEEQGLAALGKSLADKAAVRKQQIQRQRANIPAWNAIRVGGAQSDFAKQNEISVDRRSAQIARDAGETAKDLAEAISDGSPKIAGAGTTEVSDPSAAKRLVARLVGAAAAAVGRGLGAFYDYQATRLEVALDREQSLREATLEKLAEQAELDDAITEKDLEKIESKLSLDQARTEGKIGDLQAAYDVARAQRDAELAYSRDMAELEKRRTAYLQMLEDHAGLELRVERARLGVDRAVADYLGIVQRAELLSARLADLEAQRTDVNQLVGSPAAVFARANRLTRAENRLERAKDELMNWLVALEYFAVRPFMDQRLQILLARNTYQLEEIAKEMARLERSCGGAVNEDDAVLSVRDELLRVNLPSEDAVTGDELSPERRFREILSVGYVPIDKRVRYTTDSTVGDLLKDKGRVLSATFDISLDDFANLASTCNAKVASVELQLLGDIGNGRPTVTLLYDGTSKLRSCQPGIEDYVDLIGRDRTRFAEVTSLRIPGRSISPVATVNEWKDGGGGEDGKTGNVSLAGLPLASQYTVLIDTEIGENPDLDWDKLEDVLIRVRYDYSDVFAEGQCE